MEQINLLKDGNVWLAKFKYDVATKDFVKALGFRFDGDRKVWYTADPVVAAKLDPDSAGNVGRQLQASIATDADITLPRSKKGYELYPYQKAGVAYAIQRPNALIADEMGLGKTAEAIGVINMDPTIKNVLVVCPATPKLNWKAELEDWLVRPMTVGVVNDGKTLPDTDVIIINYELLVKWYDTLKHFQFDMMIVDECHKVKNPNAQRTKYLLGKWDVDPEKSVAPIQARRKLFLTGTPILNRPIELFPLLRSIDPKGMGRNKMAFAKRYCNARHNGYGWDFSGSSNQAELQLKLRSSFMIRRLKEDVLTELPPKRWQIVALKPEGKAAKIVARENELFEKSEGRIKQLIEDVSKAAEAGDESAYAKAVADLQKAQKIAFEEMSAARHATAVAKIPYCIEHINDVLEDDDTKKVVVFVHHLDVAHALEEAFPGAAVITGETPVTKRHAIWFDRFQNDPSCRVFIGGIQAASEAITLTASAHVIFCELSFVPGQLKQAEDRCHRIGQRDSLLVQHLVFDGSVDSRMASIIVSKQGIIDSILDKNKERLIPQPKSGPAITMPDVVVGPQPVKPVDTSGDFTPEQLQACHTAMQMLAGMCDGAFAQDGMGFNKIDTGFGHSLAAAPKLSQGQAKWAKKLAIKYGRQLPPDLLAIIRG